MSARRYRFGPLEQRGLVGPLTFGQVAIVAVAAALGLVALYVVRDWVGLVVALLLVGAALGAVLLPFEGRTLEAWAPIGIRWGMRSAAMKRGYRSRTPGGGFRVSGDDGAPIGEASLPEELAGLRMLEVPYGSDCVGVVHDRDAGTYTVAVAVRAGAFGLLDAAEQERKLDAWGSVLASLARDGSPIRRLQWIERTLPARPDELAGYLQAERDRAVPLDSGLVASYIELVESAAPATQEHEILLRVRVNCVEVGAITTRRSNAGQLEHEPPVVAVATKGPKVRGEVGGRRPADPAAATVVDAGALHQNVVSAAVEAFGPEATSPAIIEGVGLAGVAAAGRDVYETGNGPRH